MSTPTVIHDCVNVPGFKNVQYLAQHLTKRLTAKSLFKQVFPAGVYDGTGRVVLEPTNLVDPMRGESNDTPTWRICLDVDADLQTLTIHAATPIQISDTAEIAEANWGNEPRNPGQINYFIDRRHIKEPKASAVYPLTYALTVSDHGIFLAVWDQAFDERQDEINYWSPALRWILIQRPVDSKTGATITSGKAPVFCLYTILGAGTVPSTETFQGPLTFPQSQSVANNVIGASVEYEDVKESNYKNKAFKPVLSIEGDVEESHHPAVRDPDTGKIKQAWIEYVYSDYYSGSNNHFIVNPVTWVGDPQSPYYWPVYHKVAKSVQIHHKFVVCESDVHRPSLTVLADQNTEDSNAILNSHRQVATSEDNKYVITIPKGLNTTRYAYTYELDMIGYTSADVIGEGTEVDLPLYESSYRFRALAANRQRNTGMRILYRINTDTDVEPALADGPMDVGVSTTGNYGGGNENGQSIP